MEIYEGVIVFITVENVQKAYLKVKDSKSHLLIIENLGSIKTFNHLTSIGILNGQKAKVTGTLYFHRECPETLFLKSDPHIEKI